MSNNVVWFESTDVGAPALSSGQGALIEVLRACLVNGFGAQSVTNVTVSAGVATVLCAAHSFTGRPGQLVLLAGVSLAALNGAQQPLSVTTNSFTFAAPTAPDGVYTGTISARRAPAGWQEVYTDVGKAVFRSARVEATGALLRVLDAAGRTARVRAFESMSDIDTGTGPTPTDAQVSGGLYWTKSSTTDATARRWALVADGAGFYLCVAPTANNACTCVFAGDIVSRKAGDPYAFVVTGSHSDEATTSALVAGCVGLSRRSVPGTPGAYVLRAHTGFGASTPVTRVGMLHHGPGGDAVYSGVSGYGFGITPNAADNTTLFGGVACAEGSVYRGDLPGLLHQVQQGVLGALTEVAPAPMAGTPDRRVLRVAVGTPTGSSIGAAAFDVTGPWRAY